MLIYLSVYLVVFVITAFMASRFQKLYNNYKVGAFSSPSLGGMKYCIIGCLLFLPSISMFGLRYGIGTDYFGYESIYNAVHNSSVVEYWVSHKADVRYFYIEPGYYLLNRVFPGYRWLLWGVGILIFCTVLYSIKDYLKSINFAFAIYILLCTQYIYSLNGMRFAIAICFLLLAYKYLSQNRTKHFIIAVIMATLFHKSCLLCIFMMILKEFKNKNNNNLRNVALLLTVVLFPILSKFMLGIIRSVPLFERYSNVGFYGADEVISLKWTWMLHIFPVILPLLLLCRKELFVSEDTRVFFRISIMEIPFRMLGLYNTIYTRYSRCAQIVQVILIPLVISRMTNKDKKLLLYTYYIAWYTFYFAYYAIVNDQGDSLPYVWVFSR